MPSKRLLLIAVSGIAAFLMTTLAYAVCSVPNGFYAEGNYGTSKLMNIDYPGKWNSSGTGASAAVGYKFMRYLAVEAIYTRYGNTTISSGGITAANVRHYSYGAAAKGIFPLRDSGLELFAKLGIVRITSQLIFMNTTTATALGLQSLQGAIRSNGPYGALGAQFYVTPNIAGNIQWARSRGTTGTTGTNDLYSAGLSFIVS